MIKIITDSASQLSKKQGNEIGVEVTPLIVNINNQSYKDYEEITDLQLIQKIKDGGIPSSSQPSIGEKLDTYNYWIEQGYEIIDITMADGLSGTYQSACMAKDSCDDPSKVTVYNSRTLCVPQYVLVNKASKMARNNASKDEIIQMLDASCATSLNFMIPIDFDFLLRGGRTSNASAFLGGLLKLIPIVKGNETCTRLEKFAVARTYRKAFAQMLDYFEEHGVNQDYTICLAHALNEELLDKAIASVQKKFPGIKIVSLPLAPSLITQGGPGCIAVQTICIKQNV